MLRRRWPIAVVLSVLVAGTLLSFQNCGQLMPSSSAVSSESARELQFKRDLEIIEKLTKSALLNVWVSASNSELTKSGSNVVEAASLNPGGVRIGTVAQGPSVIATGQFKDAFSFVTGTSLSTVSPAEFMTSNSGTLFAVVDSQASGVLFRATGGGLSQAFTIEVVNKNVRARHYVTENDFESLSHPMPSTGVVIIAASFGDQLGSIKLQVNGVVATGSVQTQGSLSVSPVASRQILVGDPGDANSKLIVSELMAFATALQPYEMNTISRFLGDRAASPAFFDPSIYPRTVADDPNAVPEAVKAALRAQCSACHAPWMSYSNSDFKSAVTPYGLPLVVAGNYKGSEIYARLTNASDGTQTPDKRNMPVGGSAADATAEALKNWIQNLK